MKLDIPERLETERLNLIRLQHEDAEEIFYSYASKPEATKYLLFPTHKSLADTHTFLKHAVGSWNQGTDYSFGVRLKSSNRFIGSFGLINDNGRIQFGYALSPTHWGQGFATEACRKVMSVVKTQPGVYRVNTFVDIENTASAKVLMKSGLVEEVRLEKWFRFVNQENQPKDCILFRLPL